MLKSRSRDKIYQLVNNVPWGSLYFNQIGKNSNALIQAIFRSHYETVIRIIAAVHHHSLINSNCHQKIQKTRIPPGGALLKGEEVHKSRTTADTTETKRCKSSN